MSTSHDHVGVRARPPPGSLASLSARSPNDDPRMAGTTVAMDGAAASSRRPTGPGPSRSTSALDGERRQTRRRGFPTPQGGPGRAHADAQPLEQRTYVAPERQTLGDSSPRPGCPRSSTPLSRGPSSPTGATSGCTSRSTALGRRRLQQVEPADLNALTPRSFTAMPSTARCRPRSVVYVATILHRAFRDAVRWQLSSATPPTPPTRPGPGPKPEMQTWSG